MGTFFIVDKLWIDLNVFQKTDYKIMQVYIIYRINLDLLQIT